MSTHMVDHYTPHCRKSIEIGRPIYVLPTVMNWCTLMATSWRGISRVDSASSAFMKPGTDAMSIDLQGRGYGQARISVIVRPAGLVAG